MHSLETMTSPPSQSSANLPPLQNLPSWSRNSLERRRPPRPIVRDKLQPVQSMSETNVAKELSTGALLEEMTNVRIVSAPSGGHDIDPHQRVVHMQKSIEFLRSEQSDILERLHAEIDRLRAENKELNFKLVMARSGVSLHQDGNLELDKEEMSDINELKTEATEGTCSHPGECLMQKQPVERCHSPSQNSQLTKRQPEKKAGGSTDTPASATNKSASGKSRQSAKTKTRPSNHQDKADAPPKTPASEKNVHMVRQDVPASRKNVHVVRQDVPVPGKQSVVMVTINKDKSIRVHVPAETAPRSPTLSECKAIIKHQQDANEQQALELSKLRTDLKDAMFSSRLKSESFLSAKAYRSEERQEPAVNRIQSSFARALPKLPAREQPDRLEARMRTGQDSVSLPVLRPNNMSNFADRKRRQQAAYRARGARRDYFY